MKYLLFFLALGLLLSTCQQDNPSSTTTTDQVDLKTALRGTWQTFQINVAVNTADGKDTFRTESLTQDVWEKGYGMEPPIYYFQADQKFRLVHRSLNGEIVDQRRGLWNTFGDTLVLIEPENTIKYLVRVANGKATFRNFRDWDGDGAEDDEYQGLQRQISIGTDEQ